MGLSSSQGRLLMLTSRLSDIQLAQIMISHRQNQLAMDSEKIAKEYNEAMNNYKLTIKIPDASEAKGYSVEDLTFNNLMQMGYLLTDSKQRLYARKDENGNWVEPKDSDGNSLMQINPDGKTATLNGQVYELIDATELYQNKDIFQNSVLNGLLFVLDPSKSQSGLSLSLLEGETEIEYVLDTSDDAQAQSEYDYEAARISRQDNRLDMDMKQLETEHQAVAKEYDSVKEVIEGNVNRTFKLFSSNG